MQARQIRAQLLGKDPATAAQAATAIYSLVTELGWTQRRKVWQKRQTHVYSKEKTSKCSICGDSYIGYEVVHLGCGHRHCHECLKRNYQTVIGDPAAYPAKCCANLVLADTSFVLDDAEIRALLEMQQTHEASKIITCFSCQGDIHLSDISIDAAYCIDCHKLTCTTCKKEMHEDLCPEDPETTKLIKLAKDEGWTQCPKCNRVINRSSGCPSMICLCKANFCFRCGCSPCNCAKMNTMNNHVKSGANITFGGALGQSPPERTSKFKVNNMNRLLRVSRQKALKNQENQKVELKTLKIVRQRKELERKMAERVISLRMKMNDLNKVERAKLAEMRRSGQLQPKTPSVQSARSPVTRASRRRMVRNGLLEKPIDFNVDDKRPVAARTRSRA